MHSENSVELSFDNRLTKLLPADPSRETSCRAVHGAAYSRVKPARASAPALVAYSKEVARNLGLSEAVCASADFVEVFSGNRQLAGMDPFAMCYGGHQFGNWAGQLGDGRAINLGEALGADGAHHALQLKGAGPTPYSRSADGFAVLRSSIREFLCSEAMHHLGVATTRALSLVTSGDAVVRDMLYDGNAAAEPGAIVCRVAPSFIRFGHFELAAQRRDFDLLKTQADFVIQHYFPALWPATGKPSATTYLEWFTEVVRRTATMIVEWLRVGFVHGVMNTDNMSILGLTIDYGPYGWLDNFDPLWTPNTTDAQGRRYRFGQQSQIAMWNLAQLAHAIEPLVGAAQPLQEIVDGYRDVFERSWRTMILGKLGLSQHRGSADSALIGELFQLLMAVETDMTLFFRGLSDLTDDGGQRGLVAAYYTDAHKQPDYAERLLAWLRLYRARLADDAAGDIDAQRASMRRCNPKFVLRNYLAQQAIENAEAGDNSLVAELLQVMRRPYDEQPGKEAFAQKRPDWARHKVGCSMLSCSS